MTCGKVEQKHSGWLKKTGGFMKKNEGRVNWGRWRGEKRQRGFRGKWLNEGQQGKQSRPVTKTTINITGEVRRIRKSGEQTCYNRY